ncbi:uncharacterized protein (TIGR00369 family) [Sinobacterium caligoides]|uniref:Uncharacterized protein (TIGR00369 family) n=1 Tax=Sinobacterium caligoides TaxID=933926 RepID=A0A3N2DMF8_9GAMM|nr:PaaI family thioesterase [Sinobacterium caligoides]ROS00983.1 uncharacterized protein (TIGR00369 family) [Sinobacterium caligoides]
MNKYRQMIEELFPHIRHCMVLGMTVEDADFGLLVLRMPYLKEMVGDPKSGVVHGGTLTTLMDSACGFAAMLGVEGQAICPTLDLRIDYMGAATPGLDIIGAAEVYRDTNELLFCRGIAYHPGEEERPIAHTSATFMRADYKHLEAAGEAKS